MFAKKVSRRAMLAMTGALAAVSLLPTRDAVAAGRRSGSTTTTLTTQEKNDLIFMREEE